VVVNMETEFLNLGLDIIGLGVGGVGVGDGGRGGGASTFEMSSQLSICFIKPSRQSTTPPINHRQVFNYDFGSITTESPVIKSVYGVLKGGAGVTRGRCAN